MPPISTSTTRFRRPHAHSSVGDLYHRDTPTACLPMPRDKTGFTSRCMHRAQILMAAPGGRIDRAISRTISRDDPRAAAERFRHRHPEGPVAVGEWAKVLLDGLYLPGDKESSTVSGVSRPRDPHNSGVIAGSGLHSLSVC